MAVPSRTDIPVGRNNAVTRMALSGRWGMPDRKVRRQIARFREDDSDGMIVVSSSRGRSACAPMTRRKSAPLSLTLPPVSAACRGS